MIGPLDLSFLLLEKPNRPFHMAAMVIVEKPKGQETTFGPRLFDAYRHSEAVAPFNHKLRWLGTDVATWETVEPDMRAHVWRINLPAPGTMAQFYEMVSFLNVGLLDRSRPLWECYIIDGLEHNRLAIMIKVHHALIDGEGGLRVMRNFLSDSRHDQRLLAPWMEPENSAKPRRIRPDVSQTERLRTMMRGLTKLPGHLAGIATDVLDFGEQSLNLKPRMASMPFTARRTQFNNTAKSASRGYADTGLPLDDVKAVATATNTSLNDVVMTIIDEALHHYLRELRTPAKAPLVAFMPMSLRDESGGAGGNQVSAELIALGPPQASIVERLRQINAMTKKAKDKGRHMQTTSRQVYALVLAGSMAMADAVPGLGNAPSANLVISNMKGPAEQLYLAGAPVVAFLGLPILPPGAGLNITFASMNKALTIAIGAAPEAVREPLRLARLIDEAFQRLQAGTGTAAS
ncbi:wax ester/triacylglycerol synthase family O-acyltransferase [Mycolicibacter sinensis]|uniref:Diacylglycerol O-acyltransferase n=1 Tax=Mycolicibacter sinensis (strain JDM601) TaxID=875328 RepID=A0A1A2E5K5_MYCSD|nr:wax ester/triacylglycerol synthase family O-acyltransferase [Mycolicibacter sinensis]OBF99384.1 diacylglycerol O-acyltransferase [Mycolicibacter sinensis]OBG09167.1 diacylglycerol O-acyltransferase [Mycolicibacter sinensis]